MNQSQIGVKEIWQVDDRHFSITWTDGTQESFDVVRLRQLCPCAECVDENTGKRILKKDDISQNIRPNEIKSIGRYALGISFSDSHNTGIYSFDYLRKLSNNHH